MVTTLAIHHPRPEHVDEWIELMRQVAATAPPAVIDIVGYRDQLASNNLIAIARFETEDALNAVLPGMRVRSEERDQEWGERPSDIFILDRIDA